MLDEYGRLWRPQLERGNVAQSPNESQYPELWRGLISAYEPECGIQAQGIRDLSGKGNHGTFSSSFAGGQWVPGRGDGYAVNFNGTNNECQIGTGAILDISLDFTIAAWVNINDVTHNQYSIVGATIPGTPGVGSYFIFLHRADKGGICLQIQPATGTLFLTGTCINNLVPGKWHHVVAVNVKSQGTAALYQDGRDNRGVVDTLLGTAFTNGLVQTWGWGCWNPLTGTNVWAGKLGSTYIWNRAFTPEQVKELYEADSIFQMRNGYF